jgi:16S rRNA (guanine527-N7)-methyltransferase
VDPGRDPLPTSVAATPPLPPHYGRALDDGLASLGVVLGPAARAAIDSHARLLLAWNAAVNLTAIRDPERLAVAHVVDSLSAVALLRERRIDRFLDLGSGGGYPGLPLAAALPATRVLLVDSVGKKVRFLETVIAATGLGDRVAARTARAEALALEGAEREAWPAVVARAVAPLAELVELAFPLLVPGGFLVAWKRGDLAAELDAGARAVEGSGRGSLEVLDPGTPLLPGHRLVVASKRGRTPDHLPRDPARRRRSPW